MRRALNGRARRGQHAEHEEICGRCTPPGGSTWVGGGGGGCTVCGGGGGDGCGAGGIGIVGQ
eukprot:5857038-Prymnesium_polylepis.1